MRVPTKFGRLLVLGSALAAACVLTSCISTQSAAQPVLNTSDMAGTWVSPDGGSIAFSTSHAFTAEGLRLGEFWTGCPKSARISVSGTWEFLNSQGDSNGFTGFPTGNLLYLTFNSQVHGSPSECLGGISLTSWDTSQTPGLCLQMDPDTPCDGYVFDKH